MRFGQLPLLPNSELSPPGASGTLTRFQRPFWRMAGPRVKASQQPEPAASIWRRYAALRTVPQRATARFSGSGSYVSRAPVGDAR